MRTPKSIFCWGVTVKYRCGCAEKDEYVVHNCKRYKSKCSAWWRTHHIDRDCEVHRLASLNGSNPPTPETRKRSVTTPGSKAVREEHDQSEWEVDEEWEVAEEWKVAEESKAADRHGESGQKLVEGYDKPRQKIVDGHGESRLKLGEKIRQHGLKIADGSGEMVFKVGGTDGESGKKIAV